MRVARDARHSLPTRDASELEPRMIMPSITTHLDRFDRLDQLEHIGPTTSVNELVRRYPTALPALSALGIDSCCGGAKTLYAAAQSAGVAVDTLIATIIVPHAPTSSLALPVKDECCGCGNDCSGSI